MPTMTITGKEALNKVVSAFGGQIEARDGEIRVNRTHSCGHRGIWIIKGTKGKLVTGLCRHCGLSVQDEIDVVLRNGAAAAIHKDPEPETPPIPQKPAPLGLPPGWTLITQKTYDIVRDLRRARGAGYMPSLETLHKFDVREKPGYESSPHAQVGFPFMLGGHLFNLKVLTDAKERKYYQDGCTPKAQDVLFGLGLVFQANLRPFFSLSVEPPYDLSIDDSQFDPSLTRFHIVCLAEGEWDAMCLDECGFTAMAFLNADQRKLGQTELMLLKQADRILLFQDTDKPGEELCKFWEKELAPLATIIPMPQGVKDVCALYSKLGRGGLIEWVNAAIRKTEKPIVQVVSSDAVASLKILDMPESVMSGWLGEVCQKHLTRNNELPLAYAWPSLLTVASLITPDAADVRNRTNLLTTLVGDVHSGKDEAYDRASALFGMDLRSEGISVPRSGEGLIKWLQRRVGESQTQDSGETDLMLPSASATSYAAASPRVILFVSDLVGFMNKANIEGSNLGPHLDTLYKYDVLTTDAKKESIRIRCRLSFLGGVPMNQFDEAFKANTLGGLHDRFIFAIQPTDFTYHYSPFQSVALEIPNRTAVMLEPSVWEETKAWSTEAKQKGIDLGRTIENALRAAIICASFDGKQILDASDLGPAKALVEYQMRIRPLLQPNTGKNLEGELTVRVRHFWMKRPLANGFWCPNSRGIPTQRITAKQCLAAS